MQNYFRPLAALCTILLASCVAPRTPYMADRSPTIGMPAKLSARERSFIPEVESALTDAGLVPLSYGRGEYQLEYSIEEGPINTDTRIAILESGSEIIAGQGRASGAPLIGRTGVAEKSFKKSFDQFTRDLSVLSRRRGWGKNASSTAAPSYTPAENFSAPPLPVY
ncbi:MAG: hypothetical protein ACSHX7_06500 [Luteolibacter sp.]